MTPQATRGHQNPPLPVRSRNLNQGTLDRIELMRKCAQQTSTESCRRRDTGKGVWSPDWSITNSYIESQNADRQSVPNLSEWNEYIMYVSRDGKYRPAKEIYHLIESMNKHPWTPEALTPKASCSTLCARLARRNPTRFNRMNNMYAVPSQ